MPNISKSEQKLLDLYFAELSYGIRPKTFHSKQIFFSFFSFNSRRLKGGSIEPHPTENAIIINYTLEATVFNEPGDAMLEKSKVFLYLSLVLIQSISLSLSLSIYILCDVFFIITEHCCIKVSFVFVFIGVNIILRS